MPIAFDDILNNNKRFINDRNNLFILFSHWVLINFNFELVNEVRNKFKEKKTYRNFLHMELK